MQAGQNVPVNGAAGGVGTLAVQIAKLFGADVTGVCSASNVEMVRALGADRVIDSTQGLYARTIRKRISPGADDTTTRFSISLRTIRCPHIGASYVGREDASQPEGRPVDGWSGLWLVP
jgi:D-arabinose 1-dehydrogenase-like Zn-dependent alcohol dehydrogenase